MSGAHTHAQRGELGFAPAVGGAFSCVFSTGTAWGRVRFDDGTAELLVLGGELPPTTITVRPHAAAAAATTYRTDRPTSAGGVIRFETLNE